MNNFKPRLKTKYDESLKAELQTELGIKNPMQVPSLEKIVINAGIGREVKVNSNAAVEFAEEINQIAGQKAVIIKTQKAVSNFKIRPGMDNGIKVTLRGQAMWNFYDKLVSVALPRVKDFRGVSKKSFDRNGNFALGIKEHTVFPEIDTATRLVRARPLQVIICTTASSDEHAAALLKKLGMPFKEK